MHAITTGLGIIENGLVLYAIASVIIDAIIAGTIPYGLNIRKMTDNLPLLWSEQRKKLGFAPAPI